jgi:mTERF domain-containing protein
VVKPNVVFLRECGLCDRDIAKLGIQVERMLTAKPECVRAMAACAEGIGVPRGSGMFRQALQAVAFLSEGKITAKVDYLKKTFRWSDAEVSIAVTRTPRLLRRSKDMLQRRSEFLISEVGLKPVDIANRPVIICLSLEGRLRPRHYVLKFLKENGLQDHDRSFFAAVMKTDDVFVEKYICPHKEVAPHLAEDYAAACRGEVPANFRFT